MKQWRLSDHQNLNAEMLEKQWLGFFADQSQEEIDQSLVKSFTAIFKVSYGLDLKLTAEEVRSYMEAYVNALPE